MSEVKHVAKLCNSSWREVEALPYLGGLVGDEDLVLSLPDGEVVLPLS